MGCLSCSPASLSDRFPTRSCRKSRLKGTASRGHGIFLNCKAICSNEMMVLKHKARARLIFFHKRHFKYTQAGIAFDFFKKEQKDLFHSRRNELFHNVPFTPNKKRQGLLLRKGCIFLSISSKGTFWKRSEIFCCRFFVWPPPPPDQKTKG
jgi:hypothetical protein